MNDDAIEHAIRELTRQSRIALDLTETLRKTVLMLRAVADDALSRDAIKRPRHAPARIDIPKQKAVRDGIDMVQYRGGGGYFYRHVDNAVSKIYTTEKEAKTELNAGRVRWQTTGSGAATDQEE